MILLISALLSAFQNEALIEQLRSDAPQVREEAGRKLRQAGESARPLLEKAAQDSDVEVAARARELLLRIDLQARLGRKLLTALPDFERALPWASDSAWTQALMEATAKDATGLRHPELTAEDLNPLAGLAIRGASPAERARICKLIEVWQLRSGGPTVAKLLEDPSKEVRSAAAQALGALPFPQAVPSVLMALKTETDEWQRARLVSLLGTLESRESIPDLLSLLKRPDKDFRWRHENESALQALAEIGSDEALPELIDLMKGERVSVDSSFHRVISELNGRKALGLLKQLAQQPDHHDAALRGIASLTCRATLPEVRELLKSPDRGIRMDALGTVSALHDRESIPQLKIIAAENDFGMEFMAVRALASLRAPEAVPLIRKMMKVHDANDLIGALWQLDAAPVVPDLLEILRKNQHSRISAAYFLGFWGRDKYIDDIAPLLKDPDKFARMNSTTALSWSGRKEVIPLIAPLLKDHDAAYWAAEALGYLRLPEASGLLIDACKDKENGSRHSAARALGRTGDRSTIPFLISLLDRDEFPFQKEALASLEELGATEAIPRVRALLREDSFDIRLQSALWLTRAGGTEGVPLLLRQPRSLFALNALRQPAMWKKLGEVRFKPCFTDGDLPGLEAIAKETGLQLDVSETYSGPWPGPTFRAVTALEALEGTDIILEPGRLRIVTAREARRFWAAWWTELQGKK
jgi:HEAT repeat protein